MIANKEITFMGKAGNFKDKTQMELFPFSLPCRNKSFHSIMTLHPSKFFQFFRFQILITVLILVPAFILSGCSDEDSDISPLQNADNNYVNDWIQENMEYWYLWNTSIPEDLDKNLDPAEYFTALTNKDDRFSWIQENYQELLNSLNGISKEAGYEYILYKENESGETVVAQILYVKPSSPASQSGLKRGDLISKINGTTLTVTNYKELMKKVREDHTINYKPLDIESRTFGSETTVSLTTLQYQENPNYLKKIIEVDGKKIGYYVYNFFASGTNEIYDLEMDEFFNEFKNNNITDLILDLRFNSGGSEISSKNLASLIGAGIGSSKVFFKREYNAAVTQHILNTTSLGEAFLTAHFLDKTANIGNQLSGQRVYILTSDRTASASELIINALKPYMEVFLIGDVTYGKNVGSISIYEENNPRIKWGLQPIVTKVYNSVGSSDYSTGFVPDIENKDTGLMIYPLGDTRENLLAEAIAQITGKPVSGGRIATRAESLDRKSLGSSLDEKKRSFQLIMDNSTLPAANQNSDF
jgi:carboxyl-terminal processing protease